jgi:hypothetical protein
MNALPWGNVPFGAGSRLAAKAAAKGLAATKPACAGWDAGAGLE